MSLLINISIGLGIYIISFFIVRLIVKIRRKINKNPYESEYYGRRK